ncbi:hypothetical protein CLOSTMETH_01248 [[Clostridium] methylpentosum DSM 5476]|uniref:Uncharacterized protein n=1 Tax=[Clostridium] methylpentosum DSM 5476 TaxID=537013 RepID=C0EBN0_9FIRM|nr:hypothetical protein CLOSTMETH_01248 [[Clostridium] methylpentosum DSM 5476]
MSPLLFFRLSNLSKPAFPPRSLSIIIGQIEISQHPPNKYDTLLSVSL